MRVKGTPAILRRGPGARRVGSDPGRCAYFPALDEVDALGLEALGRIDGAQGALQGPKGGARPFLPARVRARLLAAGLLDAPLPAVSIRLLNPGVLALRIVEACASRFRILLEVEDRPTPRTLSEELGEEWLGAPLGAALANRFSRIGAPVSRARVPVPDLVLVSAERGHDPQDTRDLIVEDAPHLLLTRTEGGYEVGPAVVPGLSACAGCVAIAREEQDPFWSADILAAPRIEGLFPAGQRRSCGLPRLALETATLLGIDALGACLEAARPAPLDGRDTVRPLVGGFPGISWFDVHRSRSGRILRVGADGMMSVETIAPRAECGCGAAGDLNCPGAGSPTDEERLEGARSGAGGAAREEADPPAGPLP